MVTMTTDETDYRTALAACAALWWTNLFRERNIARNVPAAQLEVFEAALFASLAEKCLERGHEGWGIELDVDYKPCFALRDAGRAAGIQDLHLPWKVLMEIGGNGVMVRVGTHSPWDVLCTTKHGALRRAAHARLDTIFPESDMLDERLKTSWSAFTRVVGNAVHQLPVCPDGTVNEILDPIFDAAARAAFAAFSVAT